MPGKHAWQDFHDSGGVGITSNYVECGGSPPLSSVGACSGAVGEARLAQFDADCARLQHVPANQDGLQRLQAAALRICGAFARFS